MQFIVYLLLNWAFDTNIYSRLSLSVALRPQRSYTETFRDGKPRTAIFSSVQLLCVYIYNNLVMPVLDWTDLPAEPYPCSCWASDRVGDFCNAMSSGRSQALLKLRQTSVASPAEVTFQHFSSVDSMIHFWSSQSADLGNTEAPPTRSRIFRVSLTAGSRRVAGMLPHLGLSFKHLG